MASATPCTRHDRAGSDDPHLRDVLATASARAGRDLSPLLGSLYDYDGSLLATWRDAAARESFAEMLTAAWQASGADGRILNLVACDEDYDFQEDVVDNGADA